MRAGEGEDDSTRFNDFDAFAVQFFVSLNGVVEHVLVFGESRGIEDDEIVFVVRFVQEFEGFFCKGFVTRVAGEVEFHVAVGEFYGTGGNIHGVYGPGSATHGVEGEASGVAEHVEYVFAVCVFFEQAAVFALVDKESGFLSFEPIDVEFQSVFQGDEVVGSAVEVAVVRVDGGFKREGGFRFVVYSVELPAHDFEQGFGYGFALEVHSYGMELGDCHSGVDVDDESRQVVSFAVNEAVYVVVRVANQPDGTAQGVGLGDAFFPEVVIYFFFFESEDAYGNGADLVVPRGEVLVLGVVYFYEVAFLYAAFDAGYRSGEYPGVVAKEGAVFSRFECYFVHVRFSVFRGRWSLRRVSPRGFQVCKSRYFLCAGANFHGK